MYLIAIILFSIVLVVFLSGKAGWHPVWALLAGCFWVGWGSGMGGGATVSLMGEGMGKMLQNILLIVLLGAMLGVVLEASGGAVAIATSLFKRLGGKVPGLILACMGALVSIPVFCDSGYIILSRLNDAISRQTGVAKPILALSLAGGLYTTHTLVPPTPGPVAAAGNLGIADALGWVMLLGLLVSIPTILFVWWWAGRVGAKLSHITTQEEIAPSHIPAAWRAYLPILVAILLIGGGTILPKDTPFMFSHYHLWH
ncbi:MAG: hypothetical protein R2795_11065 [Saprospiraceae bacterium]